ncbi:MAG: ABC transporter ATP-binding protein [Planctomycetes bacterium]|nr:ABC transporter ATP-binding protein [Planctomycetota bacterium]
MAPVILQGVSKVYANGVKAVDCVSLSIADGEFVVLVGPSGCGKSTTLRMIAGLEEISSGSLIVGETRMNDVPARRRNMAMVFQNYALYPHLDVRRNMAFGLERRRSHGSLLKALLNSTYRDKRTAERKAIDARVSAAAATLGIESLLHRKPRELSGGQRQRVAVGRALVRDPVAFLFDEPLSNLDAKLRGEMRTELRLLHQRLRATMVYVTHDQEEAMSLADRLVVMKDGVVQQVGTPTQVYGRPANRFVAGFVGTPTMNFINGTIEAGGVFRWSAGTLQLPQARWVGLSGWQGKPLELGVRPDQIRVGTGSSRGRVIAVENYGDRMDVVIESGGLRLTSRSPTAPLREGTESSFELLLESAHLFDPAAAGNSLPHLSPTSTA